MAWYAKPTAITIPIVMIPIGVISLILGSDVSRAFTNLGGGTVIRVMGFAMAMGGILIIISTIRDDAVLEAVGLALAAFGAAIYGIGVIFGLGEQGLVAGLGYLAISLGFLGRIQLLLRTADHLRRPRHGR